jgi:hypothetical protein
VPSKLVLFNNKLKILRYEDMCIKILKGIKNIEMCHKPNKISFNIDERANASFAIKKIDKLYKDGPLILNKLVNQTNSKPYFIN